VALKSVAQIQPLSTRLNRIRLERFADPTALGFANCITNGLVPQRNLNPNASNTTYTAGKAIVGGTLHTISAGTFPAQTSDATNHCWVDDTGAVAVGAAWPGTDHTKICDLVLVGTLPTYVNLGPVARDWKLGYDPLRQALVGQPAPTPGVTSTLYTRSSTTSTSYARGWGTLGYFGRLPLITSLSAYMSTCNVSGVDKCVTARIGFMETDWATWIEGAYVDITLTNGSGTKTGALATPWMPDLGRQYVFAYVLTEYGASYVETSDFRIYGVSQHLDYPCWIIDRTGGAGKKFYQGSWTTENFSPNYTMTGYDCEGLYSEVLSDALPEEPSTFQAALHARSRNLSTGLYSTPSPTTQPLKFEASLDGGAHWTRVSEAEDLSTIYGGTALRFRVFGSNNTADELELQDVGLSYEI